MSDSKSGSKPDGISGLSGASEGENTLSEAAFGELSTEERARSGHASFLPKTILASRFQVIRFIARGGMGEVYEAEDLELHERVAVKCIRFEYAQHQNATERFRREIQLARRVTHPNVCRTYDVFRHGDKNATETGQETLIVSMELLSGKTLSREIEQRGKFTPEQALPIITQMAAGLGAAHEVGIVHRDFKCANVLLVPSEKSAESVRVVITDFGLARETATAGARLTATLDVIGTPAYMAPEQLNGGEITPATDIYALGIVMYEMLTGSTPHTADTAIAMALRRLSEPAPSPRSSVPGLDPQWDATVMHCLELQPKDRFARTEEIVKTLQGEIAAPSRSKRAGARNPWPLWLAAGIVAALLAGGGWSLYRRTGGPAAGPPSGAALPVAEKLRPSVAVLGFQNLSESKSSALLGEMLSDGLWSQLDTDEIRFIPPSQVDEMKRSLGIREITPSIDSNLLARIQEYLGCDIVITGSYRETPAAGGNTIGWNLHLLGRGVGSSGKNLNADGTEAKLNELVERAGKLIRSNLGVELTVAEESRLSNSLSTNPEALRYFSEAREKRRGFDVAAAIIALQKAIVADPEFAQAHSALAEAWSDLGYESKAAEEAKKAFDRSPRLSSEARGLIAGQYSEMTHDWAKAIENYASLRTTFVDDPNYGMLLARSQTSAGKGEAALVTLEQTQKKKNLAKGLDAQLDLARGEAQESLGNFHEQLAAASTAAAKAKALQSNLLLARARIQECSAQLNLGAPKDAKPLCEEARNLNTEAGDHLGAARAINVVANAAYQQGDLAEAKTLYLQALGISETIGDRLDEAGALNNLATILDDQGDHEGAISKYKDSIRVAELRDDKAGLAMAEQNLGVVYFESGDSATGGEMLQRAILKSRELGDKSTEAGVLNNLCMLSLQAGDPKKALQNCENSLRLRKEMDSKSFVAKSLASRGSVQLAQGNLQGARKDFLDSSQIQESLGQKADLAYTQILSGRLAIAEKRFADARGLATDAATELAVERDAAGEAEARALLAEAKAGTKDLPGAQAEIAAANKLAGKITDKQTRLRVAFAQAVVDLEAGKSDQAILALTKVEKDALDLKLVAFAMDVRLALGRAEVRFGKPAQGKLLLAQLARDARRRGFAWIAAEASRPE